MLQQHLLKFFSSTSFRGQFARLQNRAYSSRSDSDNETDPNAARQWYKTFNKSTVPEKIATTTFSRSSGPGGQKTNKTSSKATTVWPLHSLKTHLPRLLHQGLLDNRYYAHRSDTISIQCDTHRNQKDNQEETHRRLHEMIQEIYTKRIPGVTSPEQKHKIESLKKVENTARLKMKKIQGAKKRARSGGSGRGED